MILEFNNLLKTFNIPSSISYSSAWLITIAILTFISLFFNFITKRILVKTIEKFIQKSKNKIDNILIEKKIFTKLFHIIPALVIYFISEIAFKEYDWLISLTKRASLSYVILVSGIAINTLLNAFIEIYQNFKIFKEKPIRSYVQVIKIFLYILLTIFILGILMNRSPWVFLSGLGAMTAIIILVFKDSILGFVSSIQISAHDILKIGDWIEMPSYGADGDVIEVSINTVKIQNFDKTITAIPTHIFTTSSFKNWRGMQESEGRRIKRCIYIDVNTIKFCSKQMLEKFENFQYLSDYIKNKKKEVSKFNKKNQINSRVSVNGRRLTNIGIFRHYITQYLTNNLNINQDMTLIVRQLAPKEHGLPIEIYTFCRDKVWKNYESIQSDIFDHLFAAIPAFELKAFQIPSGQDIQRLISSIN